MYSLVDPNLFNVALDGVFDDCEGIVKSVAGDLEFKQRLSIGSVNSINWGRVVAQVVYYFKGYLAATQSSEQKVSFAVPSGNFGNILSGWSRSKWDCRSNDWYWRPMKTTCSTNFSYRALPRAQQYETHATSSPSMDISKSIEFRTLDFRLDRPRCRAATGTLVGAGYARRVSCGGYSDLAPHRCERADIWPQHSQRPDPPIRTTFERYGVIVDPHTADGIKVALAHIDRDVPMICLETALPAKFPETIIEALGREPERPAAYAGLETRPQRFEGCRPMPRQSSRLLRATSRESDRFYRLFEQRQDDIDREADSDLSRARSFRFSGRERPSRIRHGSPRQGLVSLSRRRCAAGTDRNRVALGVVERNAEARGDARRVAKASWRRAIW